MKWRYLILLIFLATVSWIAFKDPQSFIEGTVQSAVGSAPLAMREQTPKKKDDDESNDKEKEEKNR